MVARFLPSLLALAAAVLAPSASAWCVSASGSVGSASLVAAESCESDDF